MALSFPLTFTDRFALMTRALREAVAARIKCPPVTAGIIVYVCARLARIARDFERLARQIRSGTYVARTPARRPAVGPRGGASGAASPGPHMFHYHMGLPPFRRAWLHRVAPGDAGVWAGALRQLVSEPEMAAILATVPRMRSILRPLCFMLGVETSLLRPSMPPPPAPAPASLTGPDAPGTGSGDPGPPTGRADPPAAPRARGVDTPAGTTRIADLPGAIFFPA